MKALLFHEHGGRDVLKYEDFPVPEPKTGEALIRLRAAALNRVDLWTRVGWRGLKLDLPHIPGADGAGEIAALGAGVSRWKIGDRVVINGNLGCGACDQCQTGHDNMCREWHLLGETIRGTYCQYIALPARQLFRLPDQYDYGKAAGAALVYLTAWHSFKRGNLQQGETVLIVGATGGVNYASIAIAKHLGARVIVISAGAEKLAFAESLGADVLIDRAKEEDWSKAVYKLTEKRGVDLVVDNVGTTFPMSMRSLRKGGRILTVGNTGGAQFEIDNRFMFAKHLSIIGSTMGTLKDFDEVMSLVTADQLPSMIDQRFALQDAPLAQARLERFEQFGKIILEIE
jgi:NADPH:quinone reductase-like Zn-dependent oxidoreductase